MIINIENCPLCNSRLDIYSDEKATLYKCQKTFAWSYENENMCIQHISFCIDNRIDKIENISFFVPEKLEKFYIEIDYGTLIPLIIIRSFTGIINYNTHSNDLVKLINNFDLKGVSEFIYNMVLFS